MKNLNNLVGVSQDMHFALLNATRGNAKAQDDEQKKTKKPAADVTASNASGANTQNNNADTTTNPPANTTNTAGDNNDSTGGSIDGISAAYLQKLMTASVEDVSYVFICMATMLLIGMAPQTQQLNDIAAMTATAQKLTNNVTTVMGFFSTIEESAETGAGGLPSGFFQDSQNLEALEKACQAISDIFFSDPTNPPLQGVYCQGTTYYAEVEYNSSTHTYSLVWTTTAPTSPPSDLALVATQMFQYEVDKKGLNNPNEYPSSTWGTSANTSLIGSIQSGINQSFSALTTLYTFGSSSEADNILYYMSNVGTAVNALEPSTGGFVVLSSNAIDSYLDMGTIMQELTGIVKSFAHGYAENNNPASSNKAYQQGSALDTWYKYLQNVQNNGSTKTQDAMSAAKINTTNVSDMQQILQSIIKGNTQYQQTVTNNYKSS